MKALIAASEAIPYVKTGGLADVTGSLLKALRRNSVDASLILPFYSRIRNAFKCLKTEKSVRVPIGGVTVVGDIWVSDETSSPESYFIECDELFGRPELYGTSVGDYPDNAVRFIFFSRAVLETCIIMNIRPDVIHCNDWQTAMVPLYLKTMSGVNEYLARTGSLFTIHNLGYQGIFDASDMKYAEIGWDYFTPEGLEFYGKLNLLKAGLIFSDIINTVSETYAREILEKESGWGLEGLLRKRQDDLYGIINGLDYSEWNPEKDPLIPAHYTAAEPRGKENCRKTLLDFAGIENDRLPLIGVVSRLSSQKGIDLISDSLDDLVSLGINLIILGKGDDHYQYLFKRAAEKYRGRIFVRVGYEEQLAHLIYAGSDFFLMPSRYEPCGLGQLIAMRYGAVPIARRTGGLADTIKDCDDNISEGTGFLFSDYTSAALKDATKRALSVFADKRRMQKLVRSAMKVDFSWGRSAREYLRLYEKAIGKASE